jgi:AcrR family transcriptional regulator
MDNLRERILEKAKEKFSRYGYSQVKTDDLASELGISKRTLYEYFNSKESILGEVIDSEFKYIHDNISRIVSRAEDENVDFVQILKELWNAMSETSCTFTREFFDNLSKYAPIYYNNIEQFRIDEIKTNFTKLYSAGIKKGYIRQDIDKDVFYLIFHYSLNNILMPEVLSDLPLTTKQAVENIVEVLLTGSLTEKGRSEYIDMVNK